MPQLLSYITGSNVSDYMEFPLEPQKAFFTYAEALPDTYRHTLLCKIRVFP